MQYLNLQERKKNLNFEKIPRFGFQWQRLLGLLGEEQQVTLM